MTSWQKRTYKTEGVVLKRINLGETDRILTIYTKHYGKLRAVAKGVRKVTSRKAPHLEPFSHSLFFLARGKNLDIISEAQTVNLFSSWRDNLIKVGVAYYFCELIDKLTPDEQTNQVVFYLLKDALEKINEGSLKSQVRQFEEELLDELGFGVPREFKSQSGSLKDYIETITEREINSPKIIRSLR
jgi:DNA repair protein RecO (recombination protein O)